MNPDIQHLQPYPFEKLRALKAGITPPNDINHIALSLGEPQHAMPDFVASTMQNSLTGLQRYPVTHGTADLRQAIAQWLQQRYTLGSSNIDPDTQVIPVNGTREGLFCVAQALIDRTQKPLVLLPNPFYQIYEGAAILAGAEPYYYPCSAENDYAPDFDAIPDDAWQRCQMIYICTPGNPTGNVLSQATLQQLLAKAEAHDFSIVSDECYSEIYPEDGPAPAGLLEAAIASGHDQFQRCLVFNSLSKRSNLPGLRSGFIAGDARLLKPLLHYRTYHGCAMSLPSQAVSIAAWGDESHVIKNRQRYQQKFSAVLAILSPAWPTALTQPAGGFFLWADTSGNDEEFSQALFRQHNITVLPGSYLSRSVEGHDPGRNHVRIALVAEQAECVEAAERLHRFIQSLA